MNKVFELTYVQHLSLASGESFNDITAGYTSDAAEAARWVAARDGNAAHEALLSDDEMWAV